MHSGGPPLAWPSEPEQSLLGGGLSPAPPARRVTESILAMARPSTELLEKYGVIEQFRR